MLARRLALAALLAAVPVLSGCAASSAPDTAEATGGALSIYSSLPLQGADGTISEQIVGGEKLALAQAGGRAGPFKIGFVSLNDADPRTGTWNPGITASNAKRAAQDPSTIAYLGDFNSAATAISLPLINGAGVLQVSPASPYVGLTSSLDAGQDEPGRFYPSGKRTFARLAPGDTSEAQAQLALMRSLALHEVYVLDDQNPFAVPLATILAGDLPGAGIKLAGRESIATTPGASYEKLAEKISASGAEAVFLAGEGAASGEDSAAAAGLWRALHSADPHLKLLASSGMDTQKFVSNLGSAGSSTYLTTPALSAASYPAAAQRVLAAYRRSFGTQGGPWALYGYAAMRLVLDAIDASGAHATDRRQVIAHLYDAPTSASVLGPFAIKGNGESTLSRYGVDTVRDGSPVFLRAIQLGGGEAPGAPTSSSAAAGG